MHDDLAQQRQAGLEATPDPDREIFARGIFQPRYIIQAMMVDLGENGRERRLQIGEIHDPAGFSVGLARYVDLDTEGMPVQPRALVARRHIGKTMRRLDLEDLEDVHTKK